MSSFSIQSSAPGPGPTSWATLSEKALSYLDVREPCQLYANGNVFIWSFTHEKFTPLLTGPSPSDSLLVFPIFCEFIKMSVKHAVEVHREIGALFEKQNIPECREAIEQKAKSLHNVSCLMGFQAYKFWANGRITLEFGGEDYGNLGQPEEIEGPVTNCALDLTNDTFPQCVAVDLQEAKSLRKDCEKFYQKEEKSILRGPAVQCCECLKWIESAKKFEIYNRNFCSFGCMGTFRESHPELQQKENTSSSLRKPTSFGRYDLG